MQNNTGPLGGPVISYKAQHPYRLQGCKTSSIPFSGQMSFEFSFFSTKPTLIELRLYTLPGNGTGLFWKE